MWGAGADARIDFAELAADIAIEAEQAQALTDQIDDLDERAANLYAEADPTGIIASAPGIKPVTATVSLLGAWAIRTASTRWPRSAPTPG